MVTQTVLLVDDEPDILQLLEITLARMNLSTRRASSLAQARKVFEDITPDLCLTDMKLPDGNGLSLIQYIQDHHPDVPVAMITAHGSVESATEALKLGAFDFVTKPIALDKLRKLVGHALEIQRSTPGTPTTPLIGTAPALDALRSQINKVARSQAPVHIAGESGVGKEVVARLIHELSPRSGKPFVAVNCGAIPAELVESELFGHKQGAFTGATSDKLGLFQVASGGTLLLDEIADLPSAVQVKLLRAIQEKSVRPVGSDEEIATDVRLLSSTHKNLSQEVRAGRFRDDLYYRINVINLKVPSLRDRLDDIPALAKHLLEKIAADNGRAPKQLTADAEAALRQYSFPGNVRELENILARANALSEGVKISADELSFEDLDDHTPLTSSSITTSVADHRTSSNTPSAAETPETSDRQLLDQINGDLESFLADIERRSLNAALIEHRWNKTATAKALGISFRSLRYRLKKLGLED